MRKFNCAISALAIGAFPLAAAAQEAPAPTPGTAQQAPAAESDAAPEEGVDEIVVTGEVPGEVLGEIKPELQLNPADVRALGVSNVAELLTELAPQTRSGRGRDGGMPVMLVNGRRISNFSEIRDLPTEAILRVDIFPEELALKFGYRADQRVVNLVLRPRFRAITTELSVRSPTAGGNSVAEAQLNVLRIAGANRVSLDIEYDRTSALLESERDILPATGSLFDTRGNVTAVGGSGEVDPALSALAGTPVTVAGVPAAAAGGAPTLGDFAATANRRNVTDDSAYRTLVSPSDQLQVNGVLSRGLGPKTTASINARVEVNQRSSLLGLPGATLVLPATSPWSPFADDVQLSRYPSGALPLGRDSSTRTGHLGFSLNGDASPWRWSVTGNYDRTESESTTATGLDASLLQARITAGDPALNPFGPLPSTLFGARAPDTSQSLANVGSLDALVSGPVAELPAGQINTSIRVSGRTSDFSSSSFRSGIERASDIGRDSVNVQANLDVPIASRRLGILAPLGDLSLNGNVEVEHLSDFGRLVTTGYGAVWSPLREVRLIASVTNEEGAPSAQQLGDPIVFTPNVRVFDYVRGESVDITAIGGGNPGLGADSRNALKLGLNVRPLESTDLSFSADYNRSTIRNQIAGFPAATAQIEAAFPGRFVRDAGGRLLSIDSRPVNFARAEREELRWGFNFSMPLGSSVEKQVQRYRSQVEEARAAGQPIPPPPENLRFGRQGQRQGQGRQGGPQGEGPAQGQPGQGQPAQAGQQNAPGPQGAGRGPGGPGGGRGFGGRGGFGGPNGFLAGRVQFALYHTVRLTDRIAIGPGLPVLDLLDGAASGNRGGQPQHELELQAGVMKDGMGLRLNGRWQSGTEVSSGALGSGQTLDFSSLATLNLRLFADMGQQLSLARKHRWLRGMRITLGVDNIFDSRIRVTDANGVVPLSYQPDLLDPTGRSVRLTVRKLFF